MWWADTWIEICALLNVLIWLSQKGVFSAENKICSEMLITIHTWIISGFFIGLWRLSDSGNVDNQEIKYAFFFFLLVENIAYKKETWLNKERHSKRALAGSNDDLNRKLAEKVKIQCFVHWWTFLGTYTMILVVYKRNVTKWLVLGRIYLTPFYYHYKVFRKSVYDLEVSCNSL